ncbi:MAG: adenylyl-sulfate kinase, partial [Chitinophagaceae bacterium]
AKRPATQDIPWRLAGCLDTFLLVWAIAGSLPAGIRTALAELLLKTILYVAYSLTLRKTGLQPVANPENAKTGVAEHLFRQFYAVRRPEREQLNGHPAFTIWLTGLSGSGKSTLASGLDQWLYTRHIHSYIIDGDNTRLGINKDLDFSAAGRQENIRRVAELCKLFNEAGIVVIASFISPFEQGRREAAAIIGEEYFSEVFIDASLATCAARDKKGLYQLAREGRIKEFTGISSPYERPANPDLHLRTDEASIEESMQAIIEWIQKTKLAAYAPVAATKTALFQ